MIPIRFTPAISWAFARGALDPVGDDREDRVGALDGPVRDDEARDITQRSLATPVLDRVVVGPAAHDHGAGVLGQVAVHLLEDRGIVERPVVEPHPVLAETLLRSVVRCGDVSVQDILMSITTLPMSPPSFWR